MFSCCLCEEVCLLFSGCGRRIIPLFPKVVHLLIPENCENVTLYGKMDFPNMIKIKSHKMAKLAWIIQVGTMSLQESSKAEIFLPCGQRKSCDDRHKVRELLCCWLWRWRKGSLSQGMWDLESSRSDKRWGHRFFLRASQRNAAWLTPWF